MESSAATQHNDIVQKSSVGGKGLFAIKDHKAGECILTIERPLVTALDNKRLKDTCANCYTWTADRFMRQLVGDAEPAKLQTCAGCKTLRYCSKQCQSQSWKREHKHVCKLLGRLNEKGTLPNAARAVLRMLHLAANGQSKIALMDMKSHLSTIMARGGERLEHVLVLSTGIHEYSGTPFGMEHVQNFFAVVLTNSLTIWTPTMDPLGIAIDPLAAKANHSCDPNAVVVWDGVELQFRSLSPIKKGQEVFISYIDPTQPYSRRQNELDEKFYFKCQCSKCQLQWSSPNDQFLREPKPEESYSSQSLVEESHQDIVRAVVDDMEGKSVSESDPDFLGTKAPQESTTLSLFKGLRGLTFAQKYAYACFRKSNTSGKLEDLAVLNAGLQSCIRTGIWPEHRQPIPMIRQDAISSYILIAHKYIESYVNAFKHALKVYFDCLPHMYSQTFHPIRVINKWTIANLAITLSAGLDNSKVKSLADRGVDFGVVVWGFLKETLDNVQYSHGKGHRFAQTVLLKVDEVKTDMTRDDPARLRWAEAQIDRQWTVLRKIIQDPDVDNLSQWRGLTKT
ncbi:MAG: hypothetical protein Q9162_007047 [Coniocarpon cinnabarinum]